MNITIVIIYAAIAAFVASHTLYYGVVLRPTVPNFVSADRAVLILTALAIGVLWPLFIPGLAIVAIRYARRKLDERQRDWQVRGPQQARVG